MSIDIDPLELGFHRPFTSEVSQILKIKNPNQTPIAFKVKTTAPKQYCVRPNSGKVEPGKEVEVLVLLQAMKEDLPLEVKCKDKFLVQSVALTGDSQNSPGGPTWQNVDEADKTAIQEKKIKVAYLPPLSGSESTAKATSTPSKGSVNGVASHESEKASPSQNAYLSASPEATFTPNNRTTNRQTFGISSFELENSSPRPRQISNSAPTYEEISTKLTKAEELLAKYEKNDSSQWSKVSNEKTNNIATKNLEHSELHGPQGVPLQVVAILCFISFLSAYILF